MGRQRLRVFKFLLLATSTLVGTPGVAANADSESEALFVANNKGGTVTVLDAQTFETRCEINALPDIAERRPEWGLIHRFVNWYGEPRYADDLGLSADRKTLYVSRPSLADVAAFDVASGRLLWRTPIDGYRVDHMAVTGDGRRIFVANVLKSRVDVVDTRTHLVVGTIPTGSRPHGLIISDDGKSLLIGEMVGNAITVASVETLAVTDRLPFDAGVRPFVETKDGRTLFVQLSNLHGFVEVSTREKRALKRILLPETEKSRSFNGVYPRDAAHHGIALSPDESELCVAGTASDYVALISRPSLDVEAIVPVGAGPSWVTYSLDGRYCFASSRDGNSVSVISVAERREIKQIAVGDYPQRMIVDKAPRACNDLN